jgi:hypothetical protein
VGRPEGFHVAIVGTGTQAGHAKRSSKSAFTLSPQGWTISVIKDDAAELSIARQEKFRHERRMQGLDNRLHRMNLVVKTSIVDGHIRTIPRQFL